MPIFCQTMGYRQMIIFKVLLYIRFVYMEIIELPDVLSFEWDRGNNQKNWVKHKVSVKESEEAFYDKRGLVLEDRKHSEQEKRYILFGKTKKERFLFIIYTLRNEKIRVISARDVKKKEVRFYEETIGIA